MHIKKSQVESTEYNVVTIERLHIIILMLYDIESELYLQDTRRKTGRACREIVHTIYSSHFVDCEFITRWCQSIAQERIM